MLRTITRFPLFLVLIATGFAHFADRGRTATRSGKALLVPGTRDEVYDSGSIVFDHNGYLRNRDEFLTRLLNDLVAAAYGQDADPRPGSPTA